MGSERVEVLINRYESVSLFVGNRVKPKDKRPHQIHELCSFIAAERFSFVPKIGEVYGVYLSQTKKWVRGIVVEIFQHIDRYDYKMFLIDDGNHVMVTKLFMVPLNEFLKYPAQVEKIGLDEVLPNCTLCRKCVLFLTDFFHRGPIYFQEKRKIKNISFGDIYIEDENNTRIYLAAILLEKGLVKKTENFEQGAKDFYKSLEGFEELAYDKIFSKPERKIKEDQNNSKEQLKEDQNNSIVDEENHSVSRVHPDTGYSSSETDYPDYPRAHEDTVFYPAGFQVTNEKKSTRRSSREPVKRVRTYYEMIYDKGRNRPDRRSRSQNRTSEQTHHHNLSRSCTRLKESNMCLEDKRLNSESNTSLHKPVFQSKCIRWGETTYKDKTSIHHSEKKSILKQRGALNLNFKSELRNESEKPTGENYMVDMDSHIEPDSSKREGKCGHTYNNKTDLETKNTTKSLLEPNLNISNNLSTSANTTSTTSVGVSGSSNMSGVSSISMQTANSSLSNQSYVTLNSSNNTQLTNNSLTPNSSCSSTSNSKLTKLQLLKLKYQSKTIKSSGCEENNKPKINEELNIRQIHAAEENKIIKHQPEEVKEFNKTGRDLPPTSTNKLSKRQLLILKHQNDIKMAKSSDHVENSKSKTNDELKTSHILEAEEKIGPKYQPEEEFKKTGKDSIPIDSKPNKTLSMMERYNRSKKKSNVSIIESSSQENCNSKSKSSEDLSNHSVSNHSVSSDGSDDHFTRLAERRQKIKDWMAPTEEQVRSSGTSEMSPYASQALIRLMYTAAGVLVHSKDDKVICPVNTLADSELDISVIKGMEKWKLRDMTRIQKFSYSTVSMRRNIVIIGPQRSGKTTGYIVPLTSNLLDFGSYPELPQGNGPRALVIAASWKSVLTAATMFQDLTRQLTVIHTYGGGAELEKKVELLNGCDVLVSTPKCILRLLNYGLTNLKRLCYVVMDDAHTLFDRFKPEMEELMMHVDGMERQRDRSGLDVQLQVVLTSTYWTPEIELLVTRILNNPTICIGSPLEACVYANIKPTAIFLKSDKKLEKLIGILKEVGGKQRTVVMCRTKQDVKQVYRLLLDLGMNNVLAAHEDLTSVNISELPSMWYKEHDVTTLWEQSRVCLPILVKSDEVSDEVPVTNAQVLIHYNMADTLKKFSFRFTCLADNYRNVLKMNVAAKKCQVFILMDEENDLEVPGVMNFMKRVGTVLPQPVLETLAKLDQMKEEIKISEPLCEDLKEFGKCWDVNKCSARHILSREHDDPQDIPQSGQVKILVQYVHDACHFSARLLEHSDTAGEWRKLPTDMMLLSLKLNNFFGKEENRRLHGFASVGDLAAVETSLNVFQRAIVLKITNFDKKNNAELVNIRLVDNGCYIDELMVSRLYSLPTELQNAPPAVVDVYLCNIMPKDLDTSWSPAMQSWVEDQLRFAKRDSPNGCLVGKIVLSLGRCIWLEPLDYLEYLAEVDTTVFRISLRQDLLSTNNAIHNPNHINELHKLCQLAGIKTPEKEETKLQKPVQAKPLWAWLPQDNPEFVHVITVQAPDVIFVRLCFFNDCLMKLVEEIQKYIKEQKNCGTAKLLDINDICLGKLPGEEEWNRAMICSKPCDDQVELFFVDYGDFATVSWSDVAPISNKLITKLPFQVIECYLAGIQFHQSDDSFWEDEVIDQIYNLTRNVNEEATNLQAKVCGVEQTGSVSKGKRYKIILSDNSTDPVVLINKELISSAFVTYLENDKHLLENCGKIASVQNCSSSDSDLDISKTKRPQQNVQIVTTLQSQNDCKVLLPSEFDINEEIAVDEKERRVLQFLKEIETGDFESSLFDAKEVGQTSENDADISENENYSEGSVVSVPRSRGSLPQSADSLPKQDLEKVSAITGSSLTSTPSSQAFSKHSLYTEKIPSLDLTSKKEIYEVLNEEYLINNELFGDSVNKTSAFVYHSTPLSVTKSSSDSNYSFKCSITGKASSFTEMISHTLYRSSSSSNISTRSKFVEKVKHPSRPNSPTYYNESGTSNNYLIHHDCEETGTSSNDLIYHDCEAGRNAVKVGDETDESNHLSFSPSVKTELKYSPSAGTVITKEQRTPEYENFQNKHCINLVPSVGEKIENIHGENQTPQHKWMQVKTDPGKEEKCEESTHQSSKVQATFQEIDHVVPTYEKGGLPNVDARCPIVLWHQNEKFIWIYIKLPALTEYKFTCDVNTFKFSALYDQLPYQVNMTLFGGHKREAVYFSPKAFHFEVRLEKLLAGKKYSWPRLTKDEVKLHWLKFNVEKAFENVQESEDEDLNSEMLPPPVWNDHLTDTESFISDFSEITNTELF